MNNSTQKTMAIARNILVVCFVLFCLYNRAMASNVVVQPHQHQQMQTIPDPIRRMTIAEFNSYVLPNTIPQGTTNMDVFPYIEVEIDKEENGRPVVAKATNDIATLTHFRRLISLYQWFKEIHESDKKSPPQARRFTKKTFDEFAKNANEIISHIKKEWEMVTDTWKPGTGGQFYLYFPTPGFKYKAVDPELKKQLDAAKKEAEKYPPGMSAAGVEAANKRAQELYDDPYRLPSGNESAAFYGTPGGEGGPVLRHAPVIVPDTMPDELKKRLGMDITTENLAQYIGGTLLPQRFEKSAATVQPARSAISKKRKT